MLNTREKTRKAIDGVNIKGKKELNTIAEFLKALKVNAGGYSSDIVAVLMRRAFFAKVYTLCEGFDEERGAEDFYDEETISYFTEGGCDDLFGVNPYRYLQEFGTDSFFDIGDFIHHLEKKRKLGIYEIEAYRDRFGVYHQEYPVSVSGELAKKLSNEIGKVLAHVCKNNTWKGLVIEWYSFECPELVKEDDEDETPGENPIRYTREEWEDIANQRISELASIAVYFLEKAAAEELGVSK